MTDNPTDPAVQAKASMMNRFREVSRETGGYVIIDYDNGHLPSIKGDNGQAVVLSAIIDAISKSIDPYDFGQLGLSPKQVIIAIEFLRRLMTYDRQLLFTPQCSRCHDMFPVNDMRYEAHPLECAMNSDYTCIWLCKDCFDTLCQQI